MSKYLITGITGFVGPQLATLLISQGHDVYGLVRASNGRENDIRDIVSDKDFSKINFLYGDVTDYSGIEKIFKNHEFDGVFHLAAQSHPPTSFKDAKGTFKINSQGTVNIIESIISGQPECAMMFCSTSEVYGAVKDEVPINENFPIAPINPYGVSKAAADLYVRERAHSLKLPFFTTRAFSHTGLRRGNKFSISSDAYQIIRIKKGLQEPIISVGNLLSRRAVMDARDCVEAYAMLMEKAVNKDERIMGEAFNIGENKLFSMGELLDYMIKISGLEGKVEKKVSPDLYRLIDIPVQVCDANKLRNLTGWEPKINVLDKTLPDLLNYWDKKIRN